MHLIPEFFTVMSLTNRVNMNLRSFLKLFLLEAGISHPLGSPMSDGLSWLEWSPKALYCQITVHVSRSTWEIRDYSAIDHIFFAASSAALISGYAVGGAVSSGCVPICAVKIESIVILF